MVELEYNLDYSGVTTAPAILSQWPTNGSTISGTNFTLRGYVDDPTASIHATITDPNGTVTEIDADMERDGLFWVDDLPLTNGNSVVTLAITNAAGLGHSQSFTVTKSSVALTINPVSDASLSQAFTTVTGTIDSADYTVWVNGVKATMNGNGTWTAQNGPVTRGGTATFQAVAISNADNGGNGTAGTTPPGGPDNVQNGNPNPSGGSASAALSLDKEQPSRIRVSSFYASGTDIPDDWDPCLEAVDRPESSFWETWTEDFGGLHHVDRYGHNCGAESQSAQETAWAPDGTWLVREKVGSGDWSEWGNDCAGCSFIDHPYSLWEVRHTEERYEHLGLGLFSTVTRHTDARVELLTGGRALMPRKNIFALSVTAINRQGGHISPGQIKIQGQTVGSDGKLYLVLPDNDAVDVTPKINLDYYRYGVTHTKHKYGIKANDVVLESAEVVNGGEFVVGQKLTFSTEFSPSVPGLDLPEATQWAFPSKFVNKSSQRYNLGPDGEEIHYGAKTYHVDAQLLMQPQTPLWYVSGGHKRSRVAQLFRFSNGQLASLAARGLIRIYRPQFKGVDNAYTPNGGNGCRVNSSVFPAEIELKDDADQYSFSLNVQSENPGKLAVTQLLNGRFYYDNILGGQNDGTDGGWWMDNDDPYSHGYEQIHPGEDRVIPYLYSDGPSLQCLFHYSGIDFQFRSYLKYRPTVGTYSENIYITLAKFTWSIDSRADITMGGWTVNRNIFIQASISDSDEFPDYETTYHNPGGQQ